MNGKGEELLFEKKLNKMIFSVFVVARKCTQSARRTDEQMNGWLHKMPGKINRSSVCILLHEKD